MKSIRLRRIVGTVAMLMLTAASGALAWNSTPEHFKGTIGDFTLLDTTVNPSGPYEMHGHWSLDLKRDGKADFSMFMTMELSDYYFWSANIVPSDPTSRGAHTHHLVLTDAKVIHGDTDCPVDNPKTTPRFSVNGTPDFFTGNGSPGGFQKNGPSTVQVCITGGTDVAYSNMTMAFKGPATGHFGTQPIHGVVKFVKRDEEK